MQCANTENDWLYFGCIVADWCVGSSARPHGKTHDLPFDEDEQQHEHLKTNETCPSQMRLVRDTSYYHENWLPCLPGSRTP